MVQKYLVSTLAAALGSMVIGAAHADDGSTTLGGQAFLDFGHIKQVQEQKDGTEKEVPPTGTGFDVKRFYFIAAHRFNDIWSAQLTTDAQYSSSTTSGSGGVAEVFIKRLYLQARLNDALVVRAGAANTPWVPFVETLYEYRWVEKILSDRLGFATSADWGVNATGKFAGELLSYSASLLNGGGYKNPTRTKDVDFEGRVGVSPFSWLTVGAGYYNGHLGQVTAATQDFARNTASRWDLVAAVNVAGLRAGVEYFDAKNYKAASTTSGVLAGPAGVVVASDAVSGVKSDKADGISGWVSYALSEQFAVFGRYDHSKLSKRVVTGLTDSYYHLGLSYKAIKGIDLALVYKHEKVDDGGISVGSGDANSSYTIGGSNAATGGKFEEVGLYAQYTF